MEKSKVILVTGSSRGIGADLVRKFARRGFAVVINYSKSEEEAKGIYQEICQGTHPGNVMLVKADVSRRNEVKAMFDKVVTNYGRVDVLICNAGINTDGPFLKMSDEQWQTVIDTNLTGTFICAQEFASLFRGDIGHIITVSASTGITGRKNGCNYCSAKGGVLTLTKCLALELAPTIRVNCIVPGRINTEEVMTRLNLHDKRNYDFAISSIPMGRLGTPDDVFRVAEFIIEDSAYITGQNFFINGGDYMR